MTGSECLFATVSVHIENDAEGLDVHDASAAQLLSAMFDRRAELRESAQTAATSAIDPLFNDIAPSDRNSRAQEFLFGDGASETVTLKLPARIGWTTEGALTEIAFDKGFERQIICRYFWYFHAGDSLSFHASFEMPYDGRDLRDLYALSVFQKLIYPTEHGTGGDTPLSKLKCLSGQSFDEFMRARFNEKFEDMLEHVPSLGVRKGAKPADFWSLVRREIMPEARDLRTPLYRTLFILRDPDFFQALRDRRDMIFNENRSFEAIEGTPVGRNHSKLDVHDVEARTEATLPYYFMSGFFQNIIDFLNQDSSEIGDGTDAIYPSSEEQKNERMFFRFANGRALYQVVEASRSLEVGRDEIGTCPYIFLVHLMVLHNEMITRRYERRSDQLLNSLDQGEEPLAQVLDPGDKGSARDRADLIQELTDKVDQFRHQAFALYKRYFYSNAFRYDTERDVFTAVTRIRGVDNRMAYCDEVVKGINETAQVLETKARYQQQLQSDRSKRHLDILLGLITFMTLIEGSLRLHDVYEHLFGTPRSPTMPPICYLRPHDMCPNGDMTDIFSVYVFFGLAAFLSTLIIAFILLGASRVAGWTRSKWRRSA